MLTSSIIIATPQDTFAAACRVGLPCGIMAYGFDRFGRLIRLWQAENTQGQYMIICHNSSQHLFFDSSSVIQQIIREYKTKHFCGIIADFVGNRESHSERLLNDVSSAMATERIPFFLPEEYAACAHNETGIIISSAVSGGTLQERFASAAEKFGQQRILVDLERNCEDFSLPAPDGCGKRLTLSQLDDMFLRLLPVPFFSGELCTYYFTYKDRNECAHFVLFDNAASIRKKIETAKSLGINHFLLLYPEVSEILNDIIRR